MVTLKVRESPGSLNKGISLAKFLELKWHKVVKKLYKVNQRLLQIEWEKGELGKNWEWGRGKGFNQAFEIMETEVGQVKILQVASQQWKVVILRLSKVYVGWCNCM